VLDTAGGVASCAMLALRTQHASLRMLAVAWHTCGVDDAHCVLRHGLELAGAAAHGQHRLRCSVQLMCRTCTPQQGQCCHWRRGGATAVFVPAARRSLGRLHAQAGACSIVCRAPRSWCPLQRWCLQQPSARSTRQRTYKRRQQQHDHCLLLLLPRSPAAAGRSQRPLQALAQAAQGLEEGCSLWPAAVQGLDQQPRGGGWGSCVLVCGALRYSNICACTI
jgi:hypothetical protein